MRRMCDALDHGWGPAAVRLLSDHFQGCFGHLVRRQPVVLVKVFSHVSRLTKLAANAEGANTMTDARERERVRYLCSHAPHDLMVLNRHHPAKAGLHCGADSVEINTINKRIVDHRGCDALFGEFLSGFYRLAQERPATDQHNISAAL